jgi:type IV pilus assembly protein PilC
MAKFNYVALDAKGKEVSGVIEADSTTSAISRIREMGYFPTSIKELTKEKKPAADKSAPFPAAGRTTPKKSAGQIKIPFLGSGKVKAKILTAFTRQLATLIDAGLPLLRCLDVLRKGERNATMKNTIVKLSESVEGGSTFSEALAQHPKIFNKLYVNMVRAGEAGGVLDVTLTRLADFQEKAQRIKNKVISAMVYPSVVICVALGILSFLMIVIVPKFQEIFRDLLEGKSLPGLTLFVLAASNTIKNHFLAAAGVIAGLVIAIKLIGKTPQGRYLLDELKLRLPVFGQLLRKVGIARFSRTLGTLIASGVPILQALNIVRETAGNSVLVKSIGNIHDAVKEGERIVQPMEASRFFPPMVVSMVDVGEETGALPDMLMKIADVYDDEVDNTVAALTSLLEPIMIVFLAVVVGTIVIAMFLPLISVITTLGGGGAG